MSWDGVRRALMALVGVAGLVAVAAIVLDSNSIFLPVEEVDAAAALRDQVTILRHRVALAREGREVLLLDPTDSTLTLYLGGAPLRAWRVYSVEAGSRRFYVSKPKNDEDWRTRLWQNPRLDPPAVREHRLIVSDSVEPPDPAGEIDWVPPTPQEEVPTPPSFVAHYTGGLGFEVVAVGADSLMAGGTLVDEAVSGLRHLNPTNLDRYRIRVRMAAEDAGALYRSFPEQAALVALLPGG